MVSEPQVREALREVLEQPDRYAGDPSEVAARYSYLDDVFSGGDFFRLDATEVHYVDNSSDGDEAFEALGVAWQRQTVE